ncbi:MAG TPA: DUF4189 domain-containing protein [Variovorax sp.]|nr:DUF4189 domain-containing protein [Variovorax sp.]
MNASAAPSVPSADMASPSWKPLSRRSTARAAATALLLGAVAMASFAAPSTGSPAAAPAGTSAAMPTSTSVTTSTAESAPRHADALWGAIAARPGGYGYAFNQPSRAAAEQAARAQCERPAVGQAASGVTGATGAMGAPRSSSSVTPGRPGVGNACEVRVWFERSCGALATGNFGEWGAAVGADKSAATKAAVAQCDAHLPTEPCRAVVSVCSLP